MHLGQVVFSSQIPTRKQRHCVEDRCGQPPSILAVYAEKSVVGNEKIVEAIQKNIPSAKIVILPNAEHFVYRSNETEVLSEMKAFLGRLL